MILSFKAKNLKQLTEKIFSKYFLSLRGSDSDRGNPKI